MAQPTFETVESDPGTGGGTFLVEQVGSDVVPAALVAYSTGDGTINAVTDSGSEGLPVAVESSALPTGASTLAGQAAIQADTAVIAGDTTSLDGKITACDTGAVVIASGTITTVSTITNLAQLGGAAVPIGAGTEATAIRMTLPTDGTGQVILGAGTNGIGKLTANSGVDIGDVDVTSIVPGFAATNLGKREDDPHASQDVGVMALGVRGDTPANLSGLDGDYEPFQVSNGRLWTSAIITSLVPGTGATNLGKAEDAAHADGDTGVMALAVRTLTPANRSGTDGDYEPLQISAGRLWTSSTVTALTPGNGASNLGKAEDAAHGSGDVGVMSLGVRQDTPGNLSGTNGDYEPFQVSNGRLWTSAISLGNVAHDAVDSGNPIKTGGIARNADPSALVANLDRVDDYRDLAGRTVTTKTPRQLIVDGTASSTGTSDTAVIAAPAAGTRTMVTLIAVSNESSTDTAVLIKSATTTRLRIPAPANGGAIVRLDPPLPLGDAEALNFASAAAVTTMHVSAIGFTSR